MDMDYREIYIEKPHRENVARADKWVEEARKAGTIIEEGTLHLERRSGDAALRIEVERTGQKGKRYRCVTSDATTAFDNRHSDIFSKMANKGEAVHYYVVRRKNNTPLPFRMGACAAMALGWRTVRWGRDNRQSRVLGIVTDGKNIDLTGVEEVNGWSLENGAVVIDIMEKEA